MWLGDLFKKRDYPLFVRLPFVLVRVTPNSTSYTGNIPFFSRETCRRASLLYFVWVVVVVVAAGPFPFPPRIRTYLEESLFLTRAHTFTSTERYLSDHKQVSLIFSSSYLFHFIYCRLP